MAVEFESALPVYVFISHDYEGLIDLNGSEFTEVLAANYEVLRETEIGIWFEQTG
jgi:D-aminopeptidase